MTRLRQPDTETAVADRSDVRMEPHRGPLALLSVVLLLAGCITTAKPALHRVEMPLGSPGAVCVGSQSDVRAHSETTVFRSLDAERGICSQSVVWVGPLVPVSTLRQMLPADPSKPIELDVVLEEIALTDELGAALAPVAFERLRLVVTSGQKELTSFETSQRTLPLRIDKRGSFSPQDLALLREAVRQGRPMLAKVTLVLVQRDAQRRELAKRSRGIRLALGIRTEIASSNK